MADLYSIKKSTLTNIGDALRSKYGETKSAIIQVPYVVSKTSTATGPDTMGTSISSVYSVISIPGATKIEVNLYYSTQTFAKVYVASGEYSSNIPQDIMYQGGSPNDIAKTQLTFEDTDVITFYWECSFVGLSGLGYYAECIGYDVNGNPIEVEGGSYLDKEIEVLNTYSSADVANAIKGLSTTPEPIVLSGDCDYVCSGAIASSYLTSFGDTVTTKDLGNTNYMFYKSSLKNIPFILNYNGNGVAYNRTYMFAKCYSLIELPKMTNVCVNNLESMFESCYCLREIPENYFDNWDFSKLANTSAYQGSWSRMFLYCYSLRKLPLSMLNYANPKTTNTYSYFYYGFNYCLSLDELVGLSIPYTEDWTSNAFYNTFNYCDRLKRLSFKINEDGSPKVVNWKGQVIDLTLGVGYFSNTINIDKILNYNSGITADKEVIDDATYQALKNDPDWFSGLYQYSRYNHDSAVETINSLPDTSAYLATAGGTNTIKFKGDSGSLTDGGAINTLTEEEIAVAAAKGWTVTLV